MKNKPVVHAHSGGRKVIPGAKQKEARTGRKRNLEYKDAFKSGAFAATDPNAGRPNGRLIQGRQNATPPASEETTDVTK